MANDLKVSWNSETNTKHNVSIYLYIYKRDFFFPKKEAKKNAMKIYDLNIPSGSSNLSNSLTFWFQLHSYCGRNLF